MLLRMLPMLLEMRVMLLFGFCTQLAFLVLCKRKVLRVPHKGQ